MRSDRFQFLIQTVPSPFQVALNGSDNDSNSRNIKSIITITILCTQFWDASTTPSVLNRAVRTEEGQGGPWLPIFLRLITNCPSNNSDLLGPWTHVAGKLPLPGKNITIIRVHFFETLYSYEHKMSIKKKFHWRTSELPAKQHSPNQPKWAEAAVLLSW